MSWQLTDQRSQYGTEKRPCSGHGFSLERHPRSTFQPFVELCFPEYYDDIDWEQPVTFLDKELQKIFPESETVGQYVDKLIQVKLKTGVQEQIFIHIEVQASKVAGFPKRMFVYNYRLFDRYDKFISSFAVLCDSDPAWRPSYFGFEWHQFDIGINFPLFKLSDFSHPDRKKKLEQSENPFAMVILGQLESNRTQGDAQSQYQAKLALIRKLLRKDYPKKMILHLLKFLDWVMRLPNAVEEQLWKEVVENQESQTMGYVMSLERIAMKKGERRGEKRGEKRLEKACRNMFIEGADFELVSKIFDLPEKQIREIQKSVEAEGA